MRHTIVVEIPDETPPGRRERTEEEIGSALTSHIEHWAFRDAEVLQYHYEQIPEDPDE